MVREGYGQQTHGLESFFAPAHSPPLSQQAAAEPLRGAQSSTSTMAGSHQLALVHPDPACRLSQARRCGKGGAGLLLATATDLIKEDGGEKASG